MTIKITITREGQITNQASFPSQEEAQAWLSSHEGMGSFGRAAYSYEAELEPAVEAVYEDQSFLLAEALYEQDEMMDSEGAPFDPPQFEYVEVAPAEYEIRSVEVSPAIEAVRGMIEVPAEYVVEIVDISAQIAQEALNSESLKYLADTDWMIIREAEGGVACSQEIKDLRAAARLSIVR